MRAPRTTARAGQRGRCLAAVAVVVLAILPTACTQSSQPKPARLDFVVKDMHGNDVALASYKGRPIVLNFWATWCGPCKEEIPSLVELAAKYESQELAILGISYDDAPEDLKKFAAEHKMNYPVLVGDGHEDLLEAYEAPLGVPVSWFIRRDGTVLEKHRGILAKDVLARKIEELF